MSTGFAILKGITAKQEDKIEPAVDLVEELLRERLWQLEHKDTGAFQDQRDQYAYVAYVVQRVSDVARYIDEIVLTPPDQDVDLALLQQKWVRVAAYAIAAAEQLIVKEEEDAG